MEKKYKTIIADPPWRYGGAGRTFRAADHIYNTMDIEKLKQMPVKKIASSNSILLLWCTWPHLQSGLDLMGAWGFKYVTGFPWIKVKDISKDLWGKLQIKVRYGIGFWMRGCTETILIGKRGDISFPTNGLIGLICPQVYHSKKPNNLYEYAETLPGPYLEIFARKKRKGWDVFGNEVKESIKF